MALVSYGVSDGSDSEDEDAPEIEKIDVIKAVESIPKENGTNIVDDEKTEENTIFSRLPNPKSNFTVVDSGLSQKLLLSKPHNLTKNPMKKSVQITVPSLSELDDDLPRPTTKKVAASKKSGLFDLLPPPKYSAAASTSKKLFVPDSVKKVQSQPKQIPKPLIKTPAKPSIPIVPNPDNDSDDDDEETTDFLGLTSHAEPEIVAPESVIDIPTPEPVTYDESADDQMSVASSSNSSEDYVAFSNNDDFDQEALQRLCGGNKRRRVNVEAQLIDISESDVRPDQSEWMLKQMTEANAPKRQSHKKHGGPSNQQRRKHQITYLAYQAKENEQELQNQWANNKMTKRQTQSKYGF